MVEYAQLYPEYGFEKHKGYGSAEHIKAIKEHAPSPIPSEYIYQEFCKGVIRWLRRRRQ